MHNIDGEVGKCPPINCQKGQNVPIGLNESQWVWMSLSESQSMSENGMNRIILLHDRNQRYCREHSQKLHTNEKLHAKGALMVWKPFQTGYFRFEGDLFCLKTLCSTAFFSKFVIFFFCNLQLFVYNDNITHW